MSELDDRSKFLLDVFARHQIPKKDLILEIGAGDWRNVLALRKEGYVASFGMDKAPQNDIILPTSIEEMYERPYDVIFTMSCLFLIPEENAWVFEKIARMAQKYIFTFEGETTKGNGVIGRDYGEIFTKFGFEQIDHQTNVFNDYGVLRVFKRNVLP